MKPSMIRFFLIAFAIVFCTWQGAASDKAIRIGIEKFVLRDFQNKRLTDTLDLRSVIALNLLKNDNIRVIFLNNAAARLKKDPLGNRDSCDFILFGSFSFYEDEIYIRASLNNVASGIYFHLEPARLKLSEAYRKMDIITKQVLEKVGSELDIINAKKFAIICRTASKMKPQIYDNIRYLTNFVTRTLHVKKIALTPDSISENFYFSDQPDSVIMDSLKVDALLSLMFVKYDDKEKICNVAFRSGISKKIIQLPTITMYYKNISYSSALNYWIGGFILNVVDMDGRFNTDLFDCSNRTVSDLIGAANANSQAGNYYLSNYNLFLAMEQKPDSSALHNLAGDNFRNSGNLRFALQEYLKAKELDPQNFKAIYNLGITYTRMNDYPRAIAELENVLKYDYTNTHVMHDLGNAYNLNENYEDAILSYKNALAHEPGNDSILSSLGSAYLNMAKIDSVHSMENLNEAMSAFNAALQIQPGNSEYRKNISRVYIEMGWYYYATGSFKDAIISFKNSTFETNSEYIYDNIRLCYIYNGQLDSASNYLSLLIANDSLLTSYIYYQHAQDIRYAYLNSADTNIRSSVIYGNAVIYFAKKHTAIIPLDEYGYWLIGNTYSFLEKVDSSLLYLDSAYRLNDKNITVLLDLCESLVLNNKFESGISLINEVRKSEEVWNSFQPDKQAILLFLLASAITALDGKMPESTLNAVKNIFTKDKKTKIKNWDYGVYKNWLSDVRVIPGHDQLENLLKFMESKTDLK
ncbi:MAG: hypothetical protein NT004_01350 [Bacteroidetes bacterium]|nr:hypothetical protein [Bacteroidota bacterium]